MRTDSQMVDILPFRPLEKVRGHIPMAGAIAAALLILAGSVVAHGPGHNPVRAEYVEEKGIPGKYRDLQNPRMGESAALERGREIYGQMCVVCHGSTGAGDGPAARGLDPAPVSLGGGMMNMPGVTDGYLYWTLAEGGNPTGSAMPAFGEVLSEEDIWAVVTFLRQGFGDGPVNVESNERRMDRHHGGGHHE